MQSTINKHITLKKRHSSAATALSLANAVYRVTTEQNDSSSYATNIRGDAICEETRRVLVGGVRAGLPATRLCNGLRAPLEMHRFVCCFPSDIFIGNPFCLLLIIVYQYIYIVGKARPCDKSLAIFDRKQRFLATAVY